MNNDSKEIRIRAVLDAQSIDKSVNEIKQKLKRMTQDLSQGQGSAEALKGDNVLGKYAQQAFGDFSKESQRQMEQMFLQQRREAVNQQISIKAKQQEMEKLAKIDGELTKQQKERVGLLQKEIDLLKEKHRHTLNQAAEIKRTMDNTFGTNQQQPGMMQRIVSAAGGPRALAAGVMGGAISGAITGYGDYISSDRATLTSQGAALSGMSRELREQFQGRGSRGMFFANERAQALRMAADEYSGQGNLVGMGTAASVLGAAGTGFMMGGLPGAIVGGIGGFAGRMFMSDRARYQLTDRDRFRSLLTAEGVQNYEANLAAIKARDPRAAMAQSYFEENRGNIMNLQNNLGIRDDLGLFGAGGVLQTQMGMGGQYGGASFSEANISNQIMGIIGAGGTTAAGRGLGGFSAALQRQMGMSNASSILGTLSGAGLTNLETEDATKKLLAEAVRMGVDTSKMPQEMMRMTAMTAQIATQGGGFAAGAVNVAMAGLSGFDQTSIAAAGNAAQMFKATGKQAGGWEGQMGMGFLQSDAAQQLVGRRLGSTEMNFLNQFSFTEARGEDFRRIADFLGTDEQSARELLRQKDLFKQTRTGKEQESVQALGGFLAQQGDLTPDKLNELISSGQGAQLFTEAQAQMSASRGTSFTGQSQANQRARILQLARLNTPGLNLPQSMTMAEGQVDAALGAADTRAVTAEEGSQATGDTFRMKALSENLDRLKNAAKAHSETAEEYNMQFNYFLESMKKGANAMDGVAQQLEKVIEDLAEKGYVLSKPSE